MTEVMVMQHAKDADASTGGTPIYRRVMVGTDGSPTATTAVESAAVIAVAHRAELVVAHVFSPRVDLGGGQELFDSALFAWQATPGVRAERVADQAVERARDVGGPRLHVTTWCEPGRPVPTLLRLVEVLDVDVLVVGNRDMRAVRPLRRSVSRALSRRATCDVVVVDTVGRRARRRRSPARGATQLQPT